MGEIDIKAVQAANDTRLMNSFIKQNQHFVMKCASSAVHRYISKNDDEWSVALLAFSQAVNDYSIDKGGFLSFANLVIHRKLIDHLRSESKHRNEIPVSPSVFNCDSEEDDENIAMKTAVSKHMEQSSDNLLKLEIQTVNQCFSAYHFSFFDLTDCSPKATKTKKACAKAAVYIIQNPLIINNMRNSKTLPLKLIEKNTHIPRKILERHRKYIIAAVEIITGDYPYLADYMRFIREELDR